MTDPFRVLTAEDLPVQPDPGFAAQLRARLESALSLPNRTGDIVMSGTDTAIAELNEPAVEPDAAHSQSAVLPYLAVADTRAAIDWYIDVFGASLAGEPYEMDDGRIGHAELRIRAATLYLADEYPEIGLKAPSPQAVSVSLMLPVPDTDSTLARARDRGATVQREPYENYGARSAAIVDPFGHRWMLTGPVTGAPVPIQHGDIGYVSVWTPDANRAAAFYGHVLRWNYDPATHQVTNTTQRIGIHSVDAPPTLFCCYAVDDLEGARDSIVDGGGTVDELEHFDFGTLSGATDSQGRSFGVFAPNAGEPRPELNGSGPGELSYITYEVPDSNAFKAFYSRVLFWTFAPGRIEDGWQVNDTHPMGGVAGGSPRPVAVPMWTVENINAAVTRVREAGGTVIAEPSQQPYGQSAECTDDQGSRFYLGQL